MEQYNLTNYEIFNLTEILNKIIQENKRKEINVKLGYYLKRNFDILLPIYQTITETQQNIIQKYKNEENIIPEEDVPRANLEIMELSNIQETINLFSIPLDFVEDISLTLEEIEILSKIILE